MGEVTEVAEQAYLFSSPDVVLSVRPQDRTGAAEYVARCVGCSIRFKSTNRYLRDLWAAQHECK